MPYKFRTAVGIDIGKNFFHIGLDYRDAVMLRQRWLHPGAGAAGQRTGIINQNRAFVC